MIGFLLLTTATAAPITAVTGFSCEGVAKIEAASVERPTPFASLREQTTRLGFVRNAAGQRVQQMVPVTNVKALGGFERCRFVYASQIDMACYVGATIPDTDTTAIADRLNKTAEYVGQCLKNSALLRSEGEEGSTPTITFGGGANHPFWQITMVPSDEDITRKQAEVLILGPAPVTRPIRPARTVAKTKRRAR